MKSIVLKRTIDLLAATTALLLAAPILPILAAAVYLGMGRPVLFRQMRPGYRGKPFMLLKFRTMREACGPDGRPLPDAQRMTRLGNWLRRTSLDELPQLLNVLRGEMSLVGPRPLLMQYLDRYSPEQSRRHDVKPGLTGWAQVNGRNSLLWEEKLTLDVWYVDHQGLWLDTRILAASLWSILRPRDICHDGSATMPEFLGTAACRQDTRRPAPRQPDVDGLTTDTSEFPTPLISIPHAQRRRETAATCRSDEQSHKVARR